MIGSIAVAAVGVLNLIAACILPGQENTSFLGGAASETEYETERTSCNDSDSDPHEQDSLLPATEVKEEVSSCYESSSDKMLEVDSQSSFRMGKFT